MDSVFARGHEVPPHEAGSIQLCAANEHKPGRRTSVSWGSNLRGAVQHHHVARANVSAFSADDKGRLRRIQSHFVRPVFDGDFSARRKAYIKVKRRHQRGNRRLHTERRAHQHANRCTIALPLRNILRCGVRKIRFRFFVRFRECYPQLQAVHGGWLPTPRLRGSFTVHDAAACSHPIHSAGLDGLVGACAVVVLHAAVKQIRHRGKSDVRVGPHIVGAFTEALHRAKVVKEHKWANAALGGGRQHPQYAETSPEVLFMAPENLQAAHTTFLMNLWGRP